MINNNSSHFKYFKDHKQEIKKGIKELKVIYTDLRRYGSMKGPNFEGISEMVATSGLEVIVAGGVSDYQAVKKLKDMGVDGVIIGKAIYSGAIDLKGFGDEQIFAMIEQM